jgi:alanine racemase
MSNMSQLRPTSALVDLDVLRENLAQVRAHLPQGVKVLAAVKGDAYGHCATLCASALEAAGVEWFGVALVEEGRELREHGITGRILCLGGAGPFGGDEAIRLGLTPLVSHIDEARGLNEAAARAGKSIAIHIKVDTGMGRLGVPIHLWAHFLDRLAELPHLEVEGIASHLATSEGPDGRVSTREQTRRFEEAIAMARHRGFKPPLVHLANSGAILQHPNTAFDMVRPGLLLYGYDPGFAKPRIPVHPVMTVKTQVLVVRDLPEGVGVSYGGRFKTQRPSRLATLPVGYADGYPRALTDKAEVLVHGCRAPVRGRVCMDMCMVDVTDVPHEVRPGDEVVLLGTQGEESITANDLAGWADTIPYEILSRFSGRIPRLS